MRKIFNLALLCVASVMSFAQNVPPPPPPPDPNSGIGAPDEAPIDQYTFILLAISVGTIVLVYMVNYLHQIRLAKK